MYSKAADYSTEFLHDIVDIGLIIFEVNIDNDPSMRHFEILQAQIPNCPILLHCHCKYSEFDLLACFCMGARGYLPKSAPLPEYLRAVSVILEGRTYLPSDVKDAMINILKGYKIAQGQKVEITACS